MVPILAHSDGFHQVNAETPDRHANRASLMKMAESGPAIAAILYERGEPIEEFMVMVANTFTNNAIRVGGLVQHNHRGGDSARCLIELENVITGLRYRLTQNLGPASHSCALDITALAEASVVLRQSIDDRVQIVIVNKFGTQEATGGGLRDEMMQIVMAGIPMLTAIGQRYLPEWQQFAGEEAVILPMSLPAVLAWWEHTRSENNEAVR